MSKFQPPRTKTVGVDWLQRTFLATILYMYRLRDQANFTDICFASHMRLRGAYTLSFGPCGDFPMSGQSFGEGKPGFQSEMSQW